MSHVIDQADELRKQAIEILVTERSAIDERLALLGYDGAALSLPIKPRICGICGSAEHNSRRCPQKNAGVSGPVPQS